MGKNSSKDRKFYEKIWEDREHESEVSGDHLGDQMAAMFFAHVIPKGHYPKFRHDERNIMLMTKEEHFMYDHQTDRARQDAKFDKVFERADELRREYYKTDHHGNPRRSSMFT